MVTKILETVSILVGCGLVLYGVSLVFVPGAYVFAGLLFIGAGVDRPQKG